MKSVSEALEDDLAALALEGSLKENTAGIQAGMRRLAVTIDSLDTDPRDRAACVKELRAAYDDVVTATSGKEFTEWLERVSATN